MSESPAAPTLTPTQQAALAKIACGISQPGGVALLCGPQGVGKTTVLAHLASARQLRSLSVEVRDIAAWATAAEACRRDLPDVVVADDAHLAADGDIARLLATGWRGPVADAGLPRQSRRASDPSPRQPASLHARGVLRHARRGVGHDGS